MTSNDSCQADSGNSVGVHGRFFSPLRSTNDIGASAIACSQPGLAREVRNDGRDSVALAEPQLARTGGPAKREAPAGLLSLNTRSRHALYACSPAADTGLELSASDGPMQTALAARFRIEPGKRVKLERHDPADTSAFPDHKAAKEQSAKDAAAINHLQDRLY